VEERFNDDFHAITLPRPSNEHRFLRLLFIPTFNVSLWELEKIQRLQATTFVPAEVIMCTIACGGSWPESIQASYGLNAASSCGDLTGKDLLPLKATNVH
jgi:hypothetical protein